MNVESLVKKAQDGNKEALESLVKAIQDNIYNLAMRMLCDPEDAKDATQEILIRVITKLSTFQFKSAFRTWVYRVATNYLLTSKKIRSKDPDLSFDDYKKDLECDLEDASDLKNSIEYQLLLNEVRIGCTMAMLLCLDQKHRLTYILGDIFEFNHTEGSEILSITKANYRKQLSRARSKVVRFTSKSCGLVSEPASCSCDKKIKGAIRRGRVNQEQIEFADKSESTYVEIQQKIKETKADLKTLVLQTSVPQFKSLENFGQTIEELMANF